MYLCKNNVDCCTVSGVVSLTLRDQEEMGRRGAAEQKERDTPD